jgi:hypothetical protein
LSSSFFFSGVAFFFFFFNMARESCVSFFDESQLDSLLFGEGNNGVLSFSDGEDVLKTGSETVTTGVLDVGNFVRTGVVFNVLEDTDSTDIVSS